MEPYEFHGEGDASSRGVRTSFFTRKLAMKLEKQGASIPASVMNFLDTPLCAFSEQQAAYFEEKFRPLIPRIVTLLEEVFDELGADREGWEDMITYNARQETPIGICARAVLAKKEREAQDILTQSLQAEQRTKRIERPLCFSQPTS